MKISLFKSVWGRALVLALALAVVVVGVAYAITITVDGNVSPATEWDAITGQTPGYTDDNEDAGIADAADIDFVMWTNNDTNMYFRLNTYATPRLNGVSWILICLDTDANPSTGSTSTHAFYNQCNSQTGFEKYIRVFDNGVDGYIANVRTRNGDGTTSAGLGEFGGSSIVEISATKTQLFGSPTGCPGTMNMVVYYDGGDTDSDDNTPDIGTMAISCGNPTAVTLNDLSATSTTPWMAVVLSAGLLVTLAAGALVLRRKLA